MDSEACANAMVDIEQLILGRFRRLKLLMLQWDVPPPSELERNVALLSRAIQRLIIPPPTHSNLDQMEICFCLKFSHAIVKGLSCILENLDTALVALHICYPAMTLHLHFFFHVFVTPGIRGLTPDVLSLLKPVTKRAIAGGLQLKVTTSTDVFLPGNVKLETIIEDTHLGFS